MKSRACTAALMAVMLLSACQTTGSKALLAGIPADKISPVVETAIAADAVPVMSPAFNLAAAQIKASGANPTCGQFNMNSLAYMANPAGSGMGTGIIKTVIVGALAGVASGGVSQLGIGSSFVENMVSGTVNQVVFNSAKPVIDSVFPAADSTETLSEMEAAAKQLGCPTPTFLQGLSLKEAQMLLKQLSSEFSTAAKVVDTVKG